jgi:hypothetical protein
MQPPVCMYSFPQNASEKKGGAVRCGSGVKKGGHVSDLPTPSASWRMNLLLFFFGLRELYDLRVELLETLDVVV